MKATSSAACSQNAVPQTQEDSILTALPTDVMPNILERLPTSSFVELACTSKQVSCLVEPWFRSEADRKLATFSPSVLEESIRNLVPLFRTSCQHVSDSAWLKLLREAAAHEIDSDSIEMLLFAFATDDTRIRKLPSLPTVARLHGKPAHWTGNTASGSTSIDRMAVIFRLGVDEMMRAESFRSRPASTDQLSDRRGWKILTRIFGKFDSPRQKTLLVQVEPPRSCSANIHCAFEDLVAAHLAALQRLSWFIFDPVVGNRFDNEHYPDLLANAYSLTPSQGKTSYLLSLCLNGRPLPLKLHWKKLLPGVPRLMFRLLAYEIRRNQTLGPADHTNHLQSEIVKSFITPKELNHFTKKLNSRMDRGIRLETAVDQWMDEMKKPGECVIS